MYFDDQSQTNSFLAKDNVTPREQHLGWDLVVLQKVAVQPDNLENLFNSNIYVLNNIVKASVATHGTTASARRASTTPR